MTCHNPKLIDNKLSKPSPWDNVWMTNYMTSVKYTT